MKHLIRKLMEAQEEVRKKYNPTCEPFTRFEAEQAAIQMIEHWISEYKERYLGEDRL